jgi:hypothetical protein
MPADKHAKGVQMTPRFLVALGALVTVTAVASLALVPVGAQAPSNAKTTEAKTWTVPRTADGHPDISGIWSHNSATPLERPKELADRKFLTEDEVASLKKNAGELFNGDTDAAFGDDVFLAALRTAKGGKKEFTSNDTTGNYNHFWLVDREFDNRTSLIVDPPDGRIPALTPEAQQRRAAQAAHRKLHPFDGPEDIAVGLRCITGTVPMLGAGYNNYYQIAQGPGYVAVNMEMRHDTRMIPTDGRPHVSPNVRLWLGDPRGRWEGDTLVVDSSNFLGKADFRVAGDENMHLTERFTRVAPNTLKYEVRIDDPTTYTKPWTAVLYMKTSKDQIYEYACHEGNEAMTGTLHGERVLEEKAAQAGKTGTKTGSR